MKFKIQKPDGTFGFLVTRDANRAKKYGTVICEVKEELKEDETLDPTTGEIVKRPVTAPEPTTEQKITDLRADFDAALARIAVLESKQARAETGDSEETRQ